MSLWNLLVGCIIINGFLRESKSTHTTIPNVFFLPLDLSCHLLLRRLYIKVVDLFLVYSSYTESKDRNTSCSFFTYRPQYAVKLPKRNREGKNKKKSKISFNGMQQTG